MQRENAKSKRHQTELWGAENGGLPLTLPVILSAA